MADVPVRHTRRLGIPVGVSYPLESRYTFQWLMTPNERTLDRDPDNNDATFKNHDLPKPDDLLLHYNYGAAAVKHWGRNMEDVLNHPHPPVPPAPTRTVLESEIQESSREWDEDDVMMFFWSNTPIARERRAREEEERREYMEKWRSGISVTPHSTEDRDSS